MTWLMGMRGSIVIRLRAINSSIRFSISDVLYYSATV